MVGWFDVKFNREVSDNLLGEKLMKPMLKLGEPHAPSIRAGNANIHYHLDYIGFLTEKRKWLAGDEFSMADIAAAAHLSAIDYIGDVPWEEHQSAAQWYARVKSRPSFKSLLEDKVPGFKPVDHYENVDF